MRGLLPQFISDIQQPMRRQKLLIPEAGDQSGASIHLVVVTDALLPADVEELQRHRDIILVIEIIICNKQQVEADIVFLLRIMMFQKYLDGFGYFTQNQ